jgi:hypothetical protein
MFFRDFSVAGLMPNSSNNVKFVHSPFSCSNDIFFKWLFKFISTIALSGKFVHLVEDIGVVHCESPNEAGRQGVTLS